MSWIPSGVPSTEHRLESWKEIASYLRRTVRTVQRWEREQGLPVHRLRHNKLPTVYAFAGEMDEWWEQRRGVLEVAEALNPPVVAAGDSLGRQPTPIVLPLVEQETVDAPANDLAKREVFARNGAVPETPDQERPRSFGSPR